MPPRPIRLDLADSEVALAAPADGGWRVRFAAARVQREDGSDGYLRGLVLALAGTTGDADAAACVGRIVEGVLRVDGRALSPAELAPPAAFAGAISLHLRFAHGVELDLLAHAARLEPVDDAPFFERLAC